MKEMKLGTIGSGAIVRFMLDNVSRKDGVTLEAIYSRSKEKGAALAEAYGCQKVYTDLAAMLDDEAVNTVYIATPNSLHYAQAKQALLAGKNVICEKPFVTNLPQAKELASMAKEKRLLLAEAVPTPYLPNYAVLKEQLPKIGKVKLVVSNYSQYSARYDKLLQGGMPNIFDLQFGGGCLMDINFYNVYLNVALFGKPQSAAYYPNIYPGAADTSGVMVMKYDGFVSTNAGAKDTSGVNFFQIEGENGYLYIENGANGLPSLRLLTDTEDKTFNEQPNPDRWYYEVQALTRLFLNGDYETVYAHLQTTLNTVEVIESARKAAGIIFPTADK